MTSSASSRRESSDFSGATISRQRYSINRNGLPGRTSPGRRTTGTKLIPRSCFPAGKPPRKRAPATLPAPGRMDTGAPVPPGAVPRIPKRASAAPSFAPGRSAPLPHPSPRAPSEESSELPGPDQSKAARTQLLRRTHQVLPAGRRTLRVDTARVVFEKRTLQPQVQIARHIFAHTLGTGCRVGFAEKIGQLRGFQFRHPLGEARPDLRPARLRARLSIRADRESAFRRRHRDQLNPAASRTSLGAGDRPAMPARRQVDGRVVQDPLKREELHPVVPRPAAPQSPPSLSHPESGSTATAFPCMLDCTPMLERSARAAIPNNPDDEDFLWRLYDQPRTPEVAAFGWPPEQQEAFLRMQYRARRGSYDTAYPAAERRILLENGVPAGAMIVDRNHREIRLVDIALCGASEPRLRRARNRGSDPSGGELDSPFAPQRPARGNPAIRLYQRLGLVLKSARRHVY